MTSAGRALVLSHVTEAEWQHHVLLWATNRHWLRLHFHDSRKQEWDTDAGFPDLVLCRPPRLILAELKKERGVVSAKQRAWLTALNACPGVETYCWKPSDEDAVKAVLE